MLTCEKCGSSDGLQRLETLDDGRFVVGCLCGHRWTRGEARPQSRRPLEFEEIRKRFPGPDDVAPERMAEAERLKLEFLAARPTPEPEVAEFNESYRQIFSAEGLWSCEPRALKDFANIPIGAHLGNQSVFNNAWNELGDAEAAQKVRVSLEHLLRGPSDRPLEDRLTDLLTEHRGLGMTGLKESYLTKVLCVTQPERFLPILKYSTEAGGKREIAKAIYGLDLPRAETVQWTMGRLILWSNDVLLSLAGDGFVSPQHVARFLWQNRG